MTALDALASPARQEVVYQLGERPATVRELAAALGRTRQALHYHVALLERAGLVKGTGWRGTGPARERVYSVACSRLAFAASVAETDRGAARRAVSAMLRLSGREVDQALASPALRHGGTAPELAALRGKARLTSADLQELSRLFGRIEALLRRSRKGEGRPFYAVTLLLAPTRMAGNGAEGSP
jgi:DNA-binding transcriptional ArsR family regulator